MRVVMLTAFLGLMAFGSGAKAESARFQIKRTVGIVKKPVHYTCLVSFELNKIGNVEIRRQLGELEVVESKSLKVEGDLAKFMSSLIKESRGWERVPSSLPENAGLPEIINSVWDEEEKRWWNVQQLNGWETKSDYILRWLDKQCE